MTASVHHIATPHSEPRTASQRTPPMAEPPPSNAVVVAQVESLSRRVDDLGKDTREGRDLALSIKTILETQNMPAQIAALRGDMEKGFQGARSDLVNATDHVRRDVAELEARIVSLEQFRQRADGASGLMSWVLRNAPWLFAGIAAFAAGVLFRAGLH